MTATNLIKAIIITLAVCTAKLRYKPQHLMIYLINLRRILNCRQSWRYFAMLPTFYFKSVTKIKSFVEVNAQLLQKIRYNSFHFQLILKFPWLHFACYYRVWCSHNSIYIKWCRKTRTPENTDSLEKVWRTQEKIPLTSQW